MLNRYSAITVAFLSIGAQSASAGNEQAQRMIYPIVSASGTSLPAALRYKANGQDQARALWAPTFVDDSGGFVGTSTTAGVDGHEQARRMLVGR
ncbi:MAG: hypothetical protein M3Q32_14635 [Pseudomonadota bacterium]|nr:hypothetical protein [Pseudomonadota bacterium]